MLLKINYLVCIRRKNLRSATLTWPWRPPECSLAAALHRYSTRILFRSRILQSRRRRMKAVKKVPPSCQICTLLCKPSALKLSTLQEMERVMPTIFKRCRWITLHAVLCMLKFHHWVALWYCAAIAKQRDKNGANQVSADWGLSVWIVVIVIVVCRFVLFCCLRSGKA